MLPQYFAPNSIPSILLTGNTIAEKGAGWDEQKGEFSGKEINRTDFGLSPSFILLCKWGKWSQTKDYTLNLYDPLLLFNNFQLMWNPVPTNSAQYKAYTESVPNYSARAIFSLQNDHMTTFTNFSMAKLSITTKWTTTS
jgi:hypothetical protein